MSTISLMHVTGKTVRYYEQDEETIGSGFPW